MAGTLLFFRQDSVNLLENKDASVGPLDNENKHAPRIARSGYRRDERIKRLYARQLEGLPAKKLILDHAQKEQVSEETAWRDWREVAKLNDQDFSVERETMGARIFAMRQKVLNAALRRGQMNTAAQILDSLARQVGCDVPTMNEILPEIRVRIDQPEQIPPKEQSQLPMIDITEKESEENGSNP